MFGLFEVLSTFALFRRVVFRLIEVLTTSALLWVVVFWLIEVLKDIIWFLREVFRIAMFSKTVAQSLRITHTLFFVC